MACLLAGVHGHGRLMKPASRSTLWRVPEFGNLIPTPIPNYDDNQLYCGGIHQVDDPGSNCGVCGDPLNGAQENAKGGRYDLGHITATYSAGQVNLWDFF